MYHILDCSSLVVPENGALDTEDVMEGTVVTVTCNTGYTLLGVAVLNCLPGGKWDSFLPVCHRGEFSGQFFAVVVVCVCLYLEPSKFI